MCPRYNFVFDMETSNKLERNNPYQVKKFVWQDKPKEPFSNKGKGPRKIQGTTYIPSTSASPRELVCPTQKSETSGGKWKVVNVDGGSSYRLWGVC